MKWNKLLIISAALLLGADIFVGIMLFGLYGQTHYFDDGSVSAALELAGRDGLTVADGVLPRARPQQLIYEYAFFADNEEYYRYAASLICGDSASGGRTAESTPNFTLYMTDEGIHITSADGGMIMEFYDSGLFDFSFRRVSEETDYDELCYRIEAENDTLSLSSSSVRRKVKELAKLLGYDTKSAFSLNCTAAYQSGSRTMIEVGQTLDGTVLDGMEALCLFDGGELVFIRGSLIFCRECRGYRTELYDQLNVLFDERDSLRGAENEITELETVYIVERISGRERLYIIPAWKITCSDPESDTQSIHIRNMIDGDIVE